MEQLQAQRAALPAQYGSQGWRRDALARFAARGFPTRRDERWRYTDLKPLEDRAFALVAGAPDAQALALAGGLLAARGIAFGGPRLVFVDGCLETSMSDVGAADGIEISSLTDAWDAVGAAMGDAQSGIEHPLASLNAAFVEHGAYVRVAAGAGAGPPLELVFVGSGRETAASQPRIVLELAESAQLVVVQHFLDTDGAQAGWLNLVTDVRLAARAKLTLYRLQEHGEERFHTSLLRARLHRDASLTAGYFDRGARLARNDIDVALAEPGAKADLFGLVLGAGRRHVDNHLLVDHAAPQTTSLETFRAVLDDSSRGVFSGKVIVRPGAQKIDARQSSDNLLLSAKAEVDTKPELEIYADDVKCAHGATVGELDEDHLFYLRSRGIDENAARALLTFAFAHRAVERIDLPELRERIVGEIAGNLPEAMDWEAVS